MEPCHVATPPTALLCPPNDITKESRDGGTFYRRDRGLIGTLYCATQPAKPRCIEALNMSHIKCSRRNLLIRLDFLLIGLLQ